MTNILIFLIGLLIPSSKPCLSAWTAKLSADVPACLSSLPSLEPKIKFANFFLRKPEITQALTLLDQAKPLLPQLDYFLGQNNPATYLILLQNNYEMRANGGFSGSYAVATLDKSIPTIRFQDIYVPDGALPGHVEPPDPIQTAFGQGRWRLRDADWEPDFPKTAATFRWFFEKGNEVNPNLLLTLNLKTIEEAMTVIGEVDVPEYDLKLSPANLYALLQNQAEMNFFQGSTQKKDVLTATGRAVLKKLSSLNFTQYVQLIQLLTDQLNHGNLLVNSTDPAVQKTLEAKDWGGQFPTPPTGSVLEGRLNDTYLLVETNLGANKANCCVERKTTHTITKGETEINHLISLTLTNNSPLENPAPPRFYGGNYISYLRFYLPANATRIRITAQPTLPKTLIQYPKPFDGLTQKTFDLKDNYGLREVGFFHLTAAGTSSQVQLSYELPLDGSPTHYQLNLLKQHGLESSPQETNIFGKTSSTDLESNYTVNSPI